MRAALSSLPALLVACATGCHSDPSAPAADAGVGAITIVAGGASVYVAERARVDATASHTDTGAALSFAWSLRSVPSGSALVDSSIDGATTPAATIAPDVAGDYVLTVRAFAGGASVTSDVTVHAVDPYVFYTRSDTDGGAPYFEVHAVTASGKADHAVVCPFYPSFPNADQATQGIAFEGAGIAVDRWEGPAGTPARIAFTSIAPVGDGGFAYTMLAATEDATCASPAHAIGPVVDGANGQLAQPRFSPSGTRVARVEPTAAGYVVSTVGFDGAAYRVLGAFAAPTADAGGFVGDTILARPAWKDDAHVAWSRPVSDAEWEIVVAADTDGAAPARYVRCAGARPRQIALLRDGSIVASYAPSPGAPEDVFHVDVSGGGCGAARNLSGVPAGGRARDFDVAPDESRVVFVEADVSLRQDGGIDIPGGVLYVVPLAGTSKDKVRVGSAGQDSLAAVFGARWIAGGAELAWARPLVPTANENPLLFNSVTVAAPDGGRLRDLAKGDGVSRGATAIGNGGCDAAGARGTSFAGLALAAVVALFARRRRVT